MSTELSNGADDQVLAAVESYLQEVGAARSHDSEPTPDDAAATYEAATLAAPVDVLAGIMPRLKQNARKQRGEQKPLATKTLGRMVSDMCIVYRLLTGREARGDRDNFHDDGQYRWALDVNAVLKACNRPARAGAAAVKASSMRKRVQAIAQLCDMVHTMSHMDAARKYRAAIRLGQEHDDAQPKGPPRWSRASATAELARIRNLLAVHWQAIAAMPEGPPRTAKIVEWLRSCVMFGADCTADEDETDVTLEPLRGGCWPLVTFGTPDDVHRVHPRLEQGALGTIEETEDGDWFLTMPECTKTASDVSVNLSAACPALVTALQLLRPVALADHGGWVLPPGDAKTGVRTKRNKAATLGLLGTEYTPTDARHLCYAAAHGNSLERDEEARRRGATAGATAAAYGDK